MVQAINDDFIPILVDADKRPDVDSRYNKGGWPTTAFLNADGEVLESHNFLTTEQMMMALRRIKARYAGRGGRRRRRPLPSGLASTVAELEERPEAVGELTPSCRKRSPGGRGGGL